MRRNIIGPILGTILALGVLGVAGYGVYQAGYQSGLAETGAEVVVRGGHFYPPFGIFFGLIFLVLLFGFISRLFFWGRWRGGWYGPDSWGAQGDPPMHQHLREWHDRAHDEERRHPDSETT